MTEHIRYVCQDRIGLLTIDRPQKRNAMTSAMIVTFLDTIRRAGEEDDARVLIITGAGGAFCAGVDLQEIASDSSGDTGLPERADQRDRWWPAVECKIPVIAAVDGLAIGMGAEFSCQCDIRLASTRTRFAWNFSRRGLIPDSGAGTWLLPRLIGVQNALKFLYTGNYLHATEAKALGYVEDLLEPEELLPAAVELARQISASSPYSTRQIKRLVYNGLELPRDEHVGRSKVALEMCFQSSDFKEGIQAFIERREPEFSGK